MCTYVGLQASMTDLKQGDVGIFTAPFGFVTLPAGWLQTRVGHNVTHANLVQVKPMTGSPHERTTERTAVHNDRENRGGADAEEATGNQEEEAADRDSRSLNKDSQDGEKIKQAASEATSEED